MLEISVLSEWIFSSDYNRTSSWYSSIENLPVLYLFSSIMVTDLHATWLMCLFLIDGLSYSQGLLWCITGEESRLQCRLHGLNPWVRKNPWRRKWQPTPVLLPEKVHRQRSLAGCSLWGRKRAGHDLGTKEQQDIRRIQSNLSVRSSVFLLVQFSSCPGAWTRKIAVITALKTIPHPCGDMRPGFVSDEVQEEGIWIWPLQQSVPVSCLHTPLILSKIPPAVWTNSRETLQPSLPI